ncbi:MAG: VOC family protein [Limisphaerales bacterium]
MIEYLPRCVAFTLLLASHCPAAPKNHLPVTAISHMVIQVSDVERSVRWYRDLFGLSVVGKSTLLQFGDEPRFVRISSALDTNTGISEIGFSGAGFKTNRAVGVLNQRGASSVKHFPEAVLFEDPAGIKVQVGRFNGIDPEPAKCLLPIRDFNHFTIFVPDAKRNVQFYQQLFGLRIDTYQGPMPLIRVGDGNQFLAFVGGRSEAFIHHACFSIENFDPDRVFKRLSEYGLKPRTKKRGPVGPLEYYVVMRMPNRGGAEKGTPELYLTDPDGILLQLQDVKYAGGGGYLGEKRGTENP